MKTLIARISALIARLNAAKSPELQMEHGAAKPSPREVWDAKKITVRKMPADRVPDFRFKGQIENQIAAIQRGLVKPSR